jgi:ribosome-associated translation inhibitor RaiA
MSEQKELILRVEAKKKELQAELASVKNKLVEMLRKVKKTLKKR